jgi:hypothetical protein
VNFSQEITRNYLMEIIWNSLMEDHYFKNFFDEMMIYLFCTRPTHCVWFVLYELTETTVRRKLQKCCTTPDTLIWLWVSMSLFLNAACLVQKQQIHILIGKLGWSDKIYGNEVKHANHDITKAQN